MTGSTDLSEYLARQTFIAFDTETTGMWAPLNRIVELAAVKFGPGKDQVERFQALVNPEREIPEEVIAIHGITDEMVKDALTVGPALRQFVEFCGNDSILIAHNAPFDISFVACELDRVGLKFGNNMILDTVDIYHRFFPSLESYSLLNLVKHFGIATSQEHRALSDAELVRRLFLNAADKFRDVNSRKDMEKALTVCYMSDWPGEPTELPEDFADLNRAITEGLRVEINYHNPVTGSSLRVIRPQMAHRLGPHHYVNAYCERAGAERTFRLDRILNHRLLGRPTEGKSPRS